ncbi:AAA family ATPase [Candidatus Saccharibacteria bacterium]|nr:AAA family ATPase [Candidatus Saccharibacteria bacterium]MBR3233652.1 AAA family ATPase [Candidatus Saccharibacteria bacterium]
MEGKKSQTLSQPRAILVFGAPASGKTTFCEKFSQQFRAPYYNLNEIADEQNFPRDKVLYILDLIARSGQNLIIEGMLNTEADREEIRKLLSEQGYNPSLIWIQTDVNTIKSRLKTRLKSVAKAKEEYDRKIAELEAPAEFEKPIVLSGKHTFNTQLSHVLSQLAG